MERSGSPKVEAELYSSRIMRNYLDYVTEQYPEVPVEELLNHAGMTRDEIADRNRWFSQEQMDRFHEKLVERTGEENIAREAGRQLAFMKRPGLVGRYTLGMMNIASLCLLVEKIYPFLSRAARAESRMLSGNSAEIRVTPLPGVVERPYQCEHRLGAFESMVRYFTGAYPRVEHTSCIHHGDKDCRYILTWKRTQAQVWKRMRNISAAAGCVAAGTLYFFLPLVPWLLLLLCLLAGVGAVALHVESMEKKELAVTVDIQQEWGARLLDEVQNSNNNALLVQEIGKATAMILDRDELLKAVLGAVEKRLGYDAGTLWLLGEREHALRYHAGFGDRQELERWIGCPQESASNSSGMDDQSPAARVLRNKEPLLMSHEGGEGAVPPRSDAPPMGTCICVPVVYEKESLGIMAVGNREDSRALSFSEMNLLAGIASHLAVTLRNASLFHELHRSEEKYRSILDVMDNGYYEVDLTGNITFYNDAFMRMLGYREDELMGLNYHEYMDEENARRVFEVFNKIYRTGEPGTLFNWGLVRKDGGRCDVETFAALMKNDGGRPVGFRGITRDVTERTRREDDIRRSLEEKERILQEIHHRMKNSLQIIASMLSLQARRVADRETAELFLDSQNRVRTMALVHEKLYQAGDLSRIDFGDYINHLILRIFNFYHVNTNFIRPVVSTSAVYLDIETAVPVGLIINELVANALKHAFPGGREGEVIVTVGPGDKEEEIVLTVRDTGVGFPPGADPETVGSLGLQIVRDLSVQMQGTIEITSAQGTTVTMKLTPLSYKRRI